MPVNESKGRSQRQWEKWRNSGAVGTLSLERPAVTYPSWKSVIGMIEIRIQNPEFRELRKLFRKHREIVKESYDAWFQRATKRPEDITPDTDKLAIFNKKYLDKSSPDYNPGLIDNLGPINSMVRDSFPTISKPKR